MPATKLREMVNVLYPNKIINLTNGISAINDQITELNEQKTSVEWGMTQAKSDQDTRLVTKGDLVYTFGDYGIKNLSEFQVYDLMSVTNLTYIDADNFEIDGDQTTKFVNGLEIACDCGVDGIKYRIVSSSAYTTVTKVTLQAGTAITSNLANIYELVYEYLGTGWDADADIIANINYYDNSYAHLNDPISVSGTDGIIDKISKLNTAKSILQADKTKYEDLIILYDRFAI